MFWTSTEHFLQGKGKIDVLALLYHVFSRISVNFTDRLDGSTTRICTYIYIYSHRV